MKNGQLKPGYNLQLGVEGEFIVTAGLSSERSDTLMIVEEGSQFVCYGKVVHVELPAVAS